MLPPEIADFHLRSGLDWETVAEAALARSRLHVDVRAMVLFWVREAVADWGLDMVALASQALAAIAAASGPGSRGKLSKSFALNLTEPPARNTGQP